MQDIDTSTPHGRLLFHVLGAVDEFQADIIAENTREGLAAARARGRRGGRPRALTPEKVDRARELYAAGALSVQEIADAVGCSRATLYPRTRRVIQIAGHSWWPVIEPSRSWVTRITDRW